MYYFIKILKIGVGFEYHVTPYGNVEHYAKTHGVDFDKAAALFCFKGASVPDEDYEFTHNDKDYRLYQSNILTSELLRFLETYVEIRRVSC
ncbi:MAG: hypothetical protein ACR2M6_02670 [Vampirovibrionia bacterium]